MASLQTLSHAEARAVYDRVGAAQDRQAFYEDGAVRELIRHAAFEEASRVYEFGCGTGRLAVKLLERHLPPEATYVAVDQSPVMVELARDRAAGFGSRIDIRQSDGSVRFDLPDHAVDRVISTYVLDLLSETDIRRFVDEAHRTLVRGGRLCVAGLTHASDRRSRAVLAVWTALFRHRPQWVGGCRPIDLREHLDGRRWQVLHHGVIRRCGVPSQVLVARPVP